VNFVTYLAARFAVSPVGEGILGGIGLILIVMLLPLLLVLAPFGWIWMVYDEWREARGYDRG
jgi:hypothetical protein